MAPMYRDVNSNREMAKKAEAYDQMVAQQQMQQAQQQGAMKGLQFGREEGYQAGVVDGMTEAERAMMAQQQGLGSPNQFGMEDNASKMVVDSEGPSGPAGYGGPTVNSEAELNQLASEVNNLIQNGQMSKEEGSAILNGAYQDLQLKMQGQQPQGQGFGATGTDLTNAAKQYAMPQ